MASVTTRRRSFDDAAEQIAGAVFGSTKKAVPKTASQAREFADAIGYSPTAVPPRANGQAIAPPHVSREAHGAKLQLKLSSLVRHPDNRHPEAEEIAKRAASLREHGQLEPIVVRPLPGGKFQVLSGETRWLAAAKLKWSELEGRLQACDDAQALILLAEYNAQRSDLNPIEKGRLIKRLCEPIADGGAGLTRDAAAKKYNLESGGAATNLVRLLELPAWWQERVAKGELSQRHAREVLPLLSSTPIMAELKKQAKEPGTIKDWERSVAHAVREHARPMSGSFYDDHNGYRECRFKPSDAQRGELRIVQIKEWSDKREYALNVELWEELNAPAEKKAKEAAAKREEKLLAKYKGKSTAPKSSQKDRDEQFAKRLYAWRIDWLRYLVARDFLELDNEALIKPAVQRLLLWASVSRGGESGDSFTTMNMLHGRRQDVLYALCGESLVSPWKKLTGLAADVVEQLLPMYAARLLYSTADGPLSLVPAEVVEGLAQMLQVDTLEAWQAELAGPLTDAYLEIHTKDQLVAIAAELGVELTTGSKPQLIAQLKAHNGTKKKLPGEIGKAKAKK